jgi:hypothetical protein
MLRPVRGGFVSPEELPLRRTAPERPSEGIPDPAAESRQRQPELPAPTRVGQIPTYGLPAANGAAASGYDSLNRKRQKPKYYPAQVRPKPPAGPGSPPPPVTAAVQGRERIAPPPSDKANRTPLPPAMAGTVPGQPARKRLPVDADPFGAVGDYAGSFLIKGAVELSAGYDSNPGRLAAPQGSPFYVIAPEFLAVSDWERHAVVADLRGSFTGYGNNLTPNANGTPLSAPLDIDRPGFNGHIDGRLDVSRDTRLTGQGRLLVATDNPGSPNVQAGLARYPIYTTVGSTLGFDQNFNRLQVSGGATVDRTDGPEFDIKVDRTVTASSSSQTSGNVTVTTTSASSLVTGAGVVDAKMRLAAGGAKDRLIHVDRVRVNSYSGFFYSAAWISSRVRLKGHVGRGVTMPSAAAAPAPADATATSTPTAANP